MTNSLCSFCHFPLSENFYFCPNCGKKINDSLAPLSPTKQIGIYALSLFLPPLGLWPGIKYFFQKDPKIKKVGLIAIILTIISTVITLWGTINFVGKLNKAIGTEVNQYQDLGF